MNRHAPRVHASVTAVAVASIALVLPQCARPDEVLALPAGAVLVVRAADPAIAHQLARAFGTTTNDATTPQLVTVRADRSVTVADAADDRSWLSATVDPAALLAAFAGEVDRVKSMARGALTLAVQQQGMTAKDAAALADDVLAFPQQLHRVTLRIRGSPLDRNSRGMTIAVGLEPTPGSAFADFLAVLRPNDAGVPVLPGAARAEASVQMSVALDVAPASWVAASMRMAPFPAELRATVTSLYERMAHCMDGSMAMMFGSDDGGSRFAVGLRDAAGMASLMAGDDYRRVMSTPPTIGGRRAEVDFTPHALVHRGATFTRTTSVLDETNPLLRDGKMVSSVGVAGNWMVGTFNGDDAATKAIADTALDGGMKRVRLGDGVVLRVSADLQSLLGAVLPHQVPGMPQGLDLTVVCTGHALQLDIRLD